MTERSLSETPGAASNDDADPVAARVRAMAQGRIDEPGPLLEILHDLQHELGYLPPCTVPVVADVLNLSRAEVHGVVSFYADFRTRPPAETSIAICRGEACQAVGAEGLVDHVRSRLGVEVGAQTDDGAVELQQIFCFGNCALGPTATVAGRLHGRLTPQRLGVLIEESMAGGTTP